MSEVRKPEQSPPESQRPPPNEEAWDDSSQPSETAGRASEDVSAKPEGAGEGESGGRPGRPPSDTAPRSRRRRPPSLFWPLLLIGAGILLLLWNLGYLSNQTWSVLWRLWPLLLIAWGIEVLIGRRSTAGAVISGLLIVLLLVGGLLVALIAPYVPGLVGLSKSPEWLPFQSSEWQREHVEHPLQGISQATVEIDWSSVPGYLSALGDSSNLIEGDIDFRGQLTFQVNVSNENADVKLDTTFTAVGFVPPFGLEDDQRRWEVALSPRIPLDLTLNAGSGPCNLDLTGLQVSALVLDVGSGPVTLTLPADATFQARVGGGSGPLTIVLPENVGARVDLTSGSGPFRPGEHFSLVQGERDGDGVWETGNWSSAAHTVELRIDQGSGPVQFQ
jgi:hypothetical protein